MDVTKFMQFPRGREPGGRTSEWKRGRNPADQEPKRYSVALPEDEPPYSEGLTFAAFSST